MSLPAERTLAARPFTMRQFTMRQLAVRLLSGVLVLCAPLMAHAASYALVIGNNASPQDEPSLAPLRYADDDAIRHAALFERVARQVHVLTVLDAETQKRYPGLAQKTHPPDPRHVDAAVAAIEKAVAADRSRGESTTVYLVFSGHGSNDASGTPYLALRGGQLTTEALFAAVDRMAADRVHLIVDACNAGAVVGSRGRFEEAGELESRELSQAERQTVIEHSHLKQRPHVGAVIATAPGQQAHEWERIQAGVFSHEFISGALGAADINGDRVIEYSEIEAFMAAANRDLRDPRARPRIRAFAPQSDLRAPLVSLAGVNGPFLRVGTASIGRFRLELENGQRYLDAHLSPDVGAQLLLPLGETVYLTSSQGDVRLPAAQTGVIELGRLAMAAPSRVAARGRLDDDFEQHLFRSPFDRTYYQGFVDSRSLPSVTFTSESASNATTETDTPGQDAAQSGQWKKPAAVALWVTAGVGIVVGTWSGLQALDTRAEHERTPYPRRAEQLASDFQRQTLLSGIGYGAAALAGVTGTALWVSAPPPSSGEVAVTVHWRQTF